MKYSVAAGRISSVVKIVNFVGGAPSERNPPVAVINSVHDLTLQQIYDRFSFSH